MKQLYTYAIVQALFGFSALGCADTTTQPPAPETSGGNTAAGGSGGAAPVGGAGGSSAGTPAAAGAGASGLAGSSVGGAAGAGGTGGTGGTGGNAGSGGGDDGWTPLFNGTNLDGWTPSPGAADLYGVAQIDGGPVIHVYPTQTDQSQQPQASLRTNESYSSYAFHLEYKWGMKRYSDRKQTDRDNGICFHICNDAAQVWPESIELQIGSQAWPGDWVVGNIFMLVNKTRAQWPYTMLNNQEVFAENGTKKNIGAPASYYKALAPSQLNINDDWNTVDLTVHGDKDAEYKINGTVVNRVFDMECNEGGTWKPLDHGPIALQAEFAEVYFRNVRIKVLP